MPELPTGTVTFLFTDIEGSTPLWERHPEAMKAALARHDTLLRQAVEAHGGYVFKTVGDAFCAAFATAPQALIATLAAQRALHGETWGETPIKVRMALHTGATEERDGDYFGPPLNRVARIMSAGHGGQILLSNGVADLVREHLPEGATLCDMGKHRMKGMTQLESLFQVVVPDLPADFPPLNTLEVSSNNLPKQLTTFIGREKEVVEVKRLLSEARLVTLTGSGGCGKTRLSIRVAAELQADFPNGVWLVELAPLSDPMLVPQTVATLFGLHEEGGRPLMTAWTEHLRSKTLLLVLDNCEHLIEVCAQLAESLLHACPKLHILASSREALGIAGELPLRVPSLAAPDPAHLPALDDLTRLDSVRLFMERAVAAKPGLALTAQTAPAVAQICYRLDGIPLAIELAAARLKVLRVEQIAERLDDRFRLLTGGSRTALPRQQTLRSLIDWSHSLLSEPERVLLRRLSVFASGWTLEAAEAMCAGDGIESFEVLDWLARLVDKSLVVLDEQALEPRYRMLETIRQYARDKLLDANENDRMRDQHLEHYLRLAEAIEPNLYRPDQMKWNARLDAELDNMRAGLEWSQASSRVEAGLRLVNALHRYWIIHVYWREAYGRLQRLLASPGMPSQTRLHGRTLFMAGHLATYFGDRTAARHFSEESLQMCRALDDKEGIVNALWLIGMIDSARLDGTALPYFQESLALALSIDYAWGAAHCLSWYGLYELGLGDDESAKSLLQEGIVQAQKMGGDLDIWAWCDGHLGVIAMLQGDYITARSLLDESLSLFNQSGGKYGAAETLWQQGRLALRQKHYQQAVQHLRESLLIMREYAGSQWITKDLAYLVITHAASGQPQLAARLVGALNARDVALGSVNSQLGSLTAVAEYEGAVTAIRAQLDESTFNVAWEAGRQLTLEQAIEYALADDEPPPGG